MDNKNRPVALVFGGSSGIGEGFAKALSNTHEVVIVSRRPGTLGLRHIPGDLSTERGARAALAGISDALVERIGTIVFSAGTLVHDNGSDEAIRAMLFIKDEGARIVLQGVLGRTARPVDVVLVSSISALTDIGGSLAYCDSNRVLAQEVAPELRRLFPRANITTTYPGVTDTPMARNTVVARLAVPVEQVVQATLGALKARNPDIVPDQGAEETLALLKLQRRVLGDSLANVVQGGALKLAGLFLGRSK